MAETVGLLCGRCMIPVPVKDEVLLGDVVFHPRCANRYLEEITEMLGRKSPSLYPK